MFGRKLRFLSLVFAAIVLSASVTWALGFKIGETKEQLNLKYDIKVVDHGTGRVTVNLTIPDLRHKGSNRIQHPKGNKKGVGIPDPDRKLFNIWRGEYWKERAKEEMLRRGLN